MISGYIEKTIRRNLLTIVIRLSFGFTRKPGITTSHMFMPSSTLPFDMESPTVINMMRNMKVNRKIPLEEVHYTFPKLTKLYRGRPEMLIMKTTTGRNVQMFRGGKVQILGCVSENDAESMRHEFIEKLRLIKSIHPFQVTEMTVSNLVMSVQLKKAIALHKIKSSNADVFYEIEIFPASLIQKWLPVHIAVFNSGRVIFTGLKSFEHFYTILSNLTSFLKSSNVL